jgi:hypothetical protein
MKLKFSQQILKKYKNIKFDDNPSSCSRVVPCGEGRTGRHDEPKVAFRNIANAPKIVRVRANIPSGLKVTTALISCKLY